MICNTCRYWPNRSHFQLNSGIAFHSITQFLVGCLLVMFLLGSSAKAADIDILVIGSSHSFSKDHYSGITRNQNAFDPQLVVDELKNVLLGDSEFGAVNVVFEDVHRSTTRYITNPVGNFDMKCYSLLHYYYWPDGRTSRLNNLKGADGTAWDYVIILGDPSMIAATPGVYAKGVKLIVDTVKEGAAQPILMMQWPHDGSTVPVADFGEVTYRVGDSGGIPVAPAGYAWNDLTPKDTGTHPTAKGAYLAAATLYSKILGRNASTGSDYNYNNDNAATLALATLAEDAVQAHATQSHYAGLFNAENPYLASNHKDRVIKGDKGDGSSTEAGFLNYTPYANQRHFYNLVAPQIFVNNYDDDPSGFSGLTHFHIGRNAPAAGGKRYRAWPATYRNAIAFSFQVRNQDSNVNDGGLDHLYGIDYMADSNRGDQRAAFELISRDHVSKGVRVLPIKSIWAAVNDEMGVSTPFYTDGNHYNTDVNEAAVSYMMTLLTGRCPIGKNGTATERERRRIGYETAWIMSTLNIRPPGYTVYPSSPSAKTVTPGTSDTMSVYFINAPQSSVTVDVSVSANTAAIVNPKVLTFDATNHDTIQNVRVTGVPGATSAEVFDVNFQTTSSDINFSGLPDSWKYTNNRASTESLAIVNQPDRQETVPKNGSKTMDLQVAGSSESNTTLAAPFHGTLSWSGSDVVYTPDTDYVGSDSFAFAVNTAGTLTKGYIEITVENLPVTVTYNGNGNDGGSAPVDGTSYTVNTTVTVLAPGSLSRTGYTFSGWDTVANGSGTEYAPSDTFQITSNITLYAQWTTDATIDYFEDFNTAGQPTDPAGTPWEMHNAVNPAQATWNDFIPGDGKAYITVTSASHDDDRAYQMFNAGNVGPGQRLEIRAKNMACPGYTAFLFTYTDENWDEIDFDEIDIEIVASDDQGSDPGHALGPDGGWTDARFNCWSNADAPSYTPWVGVAKPVEDENGQAVSHMDGEWHTYTIEWINDGGLENGPNGRCVFYIDGILQYTINNMSPDSMSGVLIGYRDLAWAGPDNPIGWSGEHTMELDWYRVTPIDYHSPNAIFDSYVLQSGLNTVTQSILNNDIGSGLTAILVSQPEHGTLNLDTDGTFTYTPDTGYSGRDQFVYYATDGTSKGTSNASVVELIVNTPPTVDAGVDQTVYLTGGAPWSPADITSIAAWFDASDATTITESGGAVSQWQDKSGNNNHATQGTAANQPETGVSTLNGLNVITSRNTVKFMSVANSPTMLHGIAVTDITAGNDHDLLVIGSTSSGTHEFFVRGTGNLSFDGGGTTQGKYNLDGGAFSGFAEDQTVSTAGSHIWSGVFNSSNSLNNIVQRSGLSPSSTGEHIAEILWFSSELSDADRQKVEGYLAHKWGLTANLPIDHPYKSEAPGGTGATATLDGTASDAEQTPTATWTHVGGTGTGPVVFGNASAIDTTATFTATGTYILRLTADDGYATVYDDVTITVGEASGLPEVSVSATDGSASETGPDGGIWTITRTGDTTDPLTVNFTLGGDATSGGVDYNSSHTTSLTILATQSSATVTLTPVDDADYEGDETATLTIAGDAAYTIGTGTASITISDNDSLVLETWIVAGQSNAEGYAITESPVTGLAPSDTLSSIGRNDLNTIHTNVTIYQGTTDFGAPASSAGMTMAPRDTWHDMTSYEGMAYDWGTGIGNESGRRFGPELSFAYEVQQQVGAPIAIIKYARGSIPISPVGSTEQNGVWRDFDPSDSRANHYDKIISTIQGAIDALPANTVLNIRGVAWMQGESDANATRAPDYQANLAEFIGALRTDIGIVAGASGGKVTTSAASWNELDFLVGTIQNRNADCQTVIDAQNAVATADSHVFTVDGTTGLTTMTTDDWGDSGLHYDTAGQVLLGERFAGVAVVRLNGGYSVTYNGNGSTGGTAPPSQTKSQGVDLILASNSGSLVKTGYNFVGWNTATDGSGTTYAEGATYSIDADLALYAKWTPASGTTVTVDTGTVLTTGVKNKIGINLNAGVDDDANQHAQARPLSTALTDFGAKILRYPGGKKSLYYSWAAAPYNDPTTYSWYDWYDTVDEDTLNFDEFMAVCQSVGAEAHINVAYNPDHGLGSTLAAKWVEYANVTNSYNIKYWEIGNEMWKPELGFTTATLAALVQEYSQAMKAVDPTIKIGVSWKDGEVQSLINLCGSDLDYITRSAYTQYGGSMSAYRTASNMDLDKTLDNITLKTIVSECNTATWASDAEDMLNSTGKGLINFDMFGQFLKNPKIEYACLWNTRWYDRDGSKWDALDNRNDFTPLTHVFAIYRQFLKDSMVSASSSNGSVVTYASLSAATGDVSVFLINKALSSNTVDIGLNGGDTYEPSASLYRYIGTSYEDINPSIGDAGTATVYSGDQVYGLTLPPVSITAVSFTRLNSALPEVSVSATDSNASETDSTTSTGTYTITRTGDTTASLDVNFTLSGGATDITDYSLDAASPVTIPAGQSSVVITLTPVDDSDVEGDETATLTITADAAYTIGTASANITIADNDNNPPVFTSDPFSTADATEDSAYSATIAGSATDADGDSITYTKVNGPNWLNIATDGTLSGTPVNSDVGANSFTVSASDGVAALVEATLTITVVNTNDAPVFTSDPFSKSDASVDSAYSDSIAGSASDDDGDSLTYAKVSGPAWLTIGTDGSLSGAPAGTDVGLNSFTVSASDGIATAVAATLEITVINPADPVVLVGGSIRNGDFNVGTVDGESFAETPEWYNLTGDQGLQFTRNNLAYDGSQNAVMSSGKSAAVNTDHIIVEGDTFDLSYVWSDAWNWVDGSDQIIVSLFVTNDNTFTGVRTNLVQDYSGTSTQNDTYETVNHDAFYTATASDAGKTLFMVIEANTSAGFARIDNVELILIPGSATTTHTVTYNGNGADSGSVPVDGTTYPVGGTVTVLGNTGNLTKADYTFTGWNTVANGSGLGYVADDTFTISADTTLYAQWTPNQIADIDLPAGISLYGYTGQNPIDAQAAFQTLIDNSQLSLVRWVNPSGGGIKELYYTTFPSAAWVNEIGDLTLGQGYVVKTTTACTLSVNGNKDTSSLSHNLPAGYSIVGFNQETPLNALTAFQPLIDAGKLDLVRWVEPSSGSIKELYFTTFPSAEWVNEIGDLTEGQGYIIKLNAPHDGFTLP